jgi:hypothetical protein
MSALEGMIGHPVAFLVALVFSAPFVWVLAQMFFRDIAEELKRESPYYLVDVMLPDWDFLSWPLVKLILVLFFSAAVITLFYQLCAWAAS